MGGNLFSRTTVVPAEPPRRSRSNVAASFGSDDTTDNIPPSPTAILSQTPPSAGGGGGGHSSHQITVPTTLDFRRDFTHSMSNVSGVGIGTTPGPTPTPRRSGTKSGYTPSHARRSSAASAILSAFTPAHAYHHSSSAVVPGHTAPTSTPSPATPMHSHSHSHSHTQQLQNNPHGQSALQGGSGSSVAIDSELSSHSILEMLPEVVVVVDRASSIVWCNKQVLPHLGYSPAELTGQPLQVLIPARVYPHLDHSLLSRRYTPGAPSNIVGHTGRLITIQRKDGTLMDMKLSVTMHGEYFCGTMSPVEGAHGMNDQAVSLVTHETRNFLTVARGCVEAAVMQLGEAPAHASIALSNGSFVRVADVCENMSHALEAIDSSVSVMRDLTTMTQAAAQTLQVNREWMHTSELTAKLEAYASGFIGKSSKSVIVHCNNDTAPSVSVELCVQHVQQLVMNLLANGLRHAKSEVLVNINMYIPHQEDDLVATVTVTIDVDDDGPGMPAKDRAMLFRNFNRQAARRAGDVGRGPLETGIGVHLSQIFAAEHDGKVEVAESGCHPTGSLFTATLALPYRIESTSNRNVLAAGSEQSNPMENMRCCVLVVDDVDLIRRLIEKFVQKLMPLATITGAATVEEARLLLVDRQFDLVLTDYSLPDGTGADIIQGLAGTLCVCVSGSQPPEGVFDAVLVKPVAYTDLKNLLVKQLLPRIAQLH